MVAVQEDSVMDIGMGKDQLIECWVNPRGSKPYKIIQDNQWESDSTRSVAHMARTHLNKHELIDIDVTFGCCLSMSFLECMKCVASLR